MRFGPRAAPKPPRAPKYFGANLARVKGSPETLPRGVGKRVWFEPASGARTRAHAKSRIRYSCSTRSATLTFPHQYQSFTCITVSLCHDSHDSLRPVAEVSDSRARCGTSSKAWKSQRNDQELAAVGKLLKLALLRLRIQRRARNGRPSLRSNASMPMNSFRGSPPQVKRRPQHSCSLVEMSVEPSPIGL